MKTVGTIIGRIPLTETSLIVQWCTGEQGLLKTVAKGARRPKSPFAGKVDLFYKCEIEVHPARRGDLHILKDLMVLDSRFGLRRSYLQTLGASYFVKLINRGAESETPIPELDDLLNRALDYLNGTDVNLRAVHHFEKQMADILGISHPETEPVTSLADHFGSLPDQREELMKRLKSP
ncbi:MAG: recombination protein O N-terminal domain-containing protein [Verrucomicrobiales bacterium]|nr:recombination protein O N-terminal domain-containing protein [Verrucomicrobiales bacterium]